MDRLFIIYHYNAQSSHLWLSHLVQEIYRAVCKNNSARCTSRISSWSGLSLLSCFISGHPVTDFLLHLVPFYQLLSWNPATSLLVFTLKILIICFIPIFQLVFSLPAQGALKLITSKEPSKHSPRPLSLTLALTDSSTGKLFFTHCSVLGVKLSTGIGLKFRVIFW